MYSNMLYCNDFLWLSLNGCLRRDGHEEGCRKIN